MTRAQHRAASRAAAKGDRTRATRLAFINVKRRKLGLAPLKGGDTQQAPKKGAVSGLAPGKGKKPVVIRDKKRSEALKKADRAKARHKATGLLAGQWIGKANEVVPCCASTAVANSLLAGTGWRVSDDDVIALHLAAGGTFFDGAPLEDVLAAAEAGALAGIRPQVVPALWWAPGVVAGLAVPGWEPHAVTMTDSGPVSWGCETDDQLLVHAEEAWQLTW